MKKLIKVASVVAVVAMLSGCIIDGGHGRGPGWGPPHGGWHGGGWHHGPGPGRHW